MDIIPDDSEYCTIETDDKENSTLQALTYLFSGDMYNLKKKRVKIVADTQGLIVNIFLLKPKKKVYQYTEGKVQEYADTQRAVHQAHRAAHSSDKYFESIERSFSKNKKVQDKYKTMLEKMQFPRNEKYAFLQNLGTPYSIGEMADIAFFTGVVEALKVYSTTTDLRKDEFVRIQYNEYMKIAKYISHMNGSPYSFDTFIAEMKNVADLL